MDGGGDAQMGWDMGWPAGGVVWSEVSDREVEEASSQKVVALGLVKLDTVRRPIMPPCAQCFAEPTARCFSLLVFGGCQKGDSGSAVVCSWTLVLLLPRTRI